MAAPFVQDAKRSNYDGVNSHNLPAISAAVAGNALLAIFFGDDAGDDRAFATPAGWTKVADHDDGGSYSVAIFGKVAAGGETGGNAITWTGNDHFNANSYLAEIDGAGLDTNPANWDVALNVEGFVTGFTYPDFTIDLANSLHILAYVSGDCTTTPPTGYNEEQDDGGAGGFWVAQDVVSAGTKSGLAVTKGNFTTTSIQIEITATPPPTAAITGTATAAIGEADVVAGGKTVIITLTNDTWVASGGTFDAQRQAIIDGLDSAQSEATGWNVEVRDNLAVTDVVRTSATVVTITLSAQAAYQIKNREYITVTVPASAVTGAAIINATPAPAFSVAEEGASAGQGWVMGSELAYMGEMEMGAPDTVAGNVTVTPTTLTLTIAPFAPQLKAQLSPSTLALALSAFTPQLKEQLSPSTLALVLATFAPRLQEQLSPSTSALVLTAFAPQLRESLSPGTLALVLSAFSPQLQERLSPSTASLVLSAFAPDVSFTANQVVTPTTLALVLASFAPQLQERLTPDTLPLILATLPPILREILTVTTVALILSTFAPDVTSGANQVVTLDTLALLLSTFAPQLQERLIPALLALTLTTFAPQLRESLNPSTLALLLTSFAPVLREALSPSTLALVLSTFAPTVTGTANALVTPDTLPLILTTFPPDLNLPTLIEPGTLPLTLTAFAPQLQERIPVAPGSLVLTGFPPVLQERLSPGTASLVLTGFPPNVGQALVVSPETLPLVLTGFAPQLREVVVPATLPLILTLFSPIAIPGGGNILVTPLTASLILSLFAPDVTLLLPDYTPGGYWPPRRRVFLHQINQNVVRVRSLQ